MLSYTNCVLFSFTIILISFKSCKSDLLPPLAPSLALYTPGEPEYTDILVKRVGDNLTLVCELKGDIAPRLYVWNYVAANGSAGDSKQFTIDPVGVTAASTLTKPGLQLSDSGQYMCSAPPFSITKYIHVQTRGPRQCARGAFWCGARCVLATYVCDGRRDCLKAEDEAPSLCGPQPCLRSDRLNCSTGRCIPEAACCRGAGPAALCRQPACCDEHPRFSRVEGYVDMEYPALFEDRHAPDDYGFIQSTIYTVTACALIFMIAVVLLVSAICKMHMKRAALRSYANADRATRQHYNMHYAQAHRFPPCYEASRLLEQEAGAAGVAPSPAQSANSSPTRQHNLQCNTECTQEEAPVDCVERTPDECRGSGFGLARLSAIFTSRYRQVPTQCCDVEMTDVRSTSLNNSPTRNQIRTRLDDYRSPTYCDLNADFLFNNPETGNCGRDLNYMATPVEFFRRRTLRTSALERVIDQIDRQRPLTLHVGRFQLSIPRFSRRSSSDRRPDTPNVAEINIDDLDFVRLNSNDTYTLNGRTIRLLGANFENYPVLSDTTVRPPPYNEAMRYKLYGPPPEYLSREGLNNEREIVTLSTNNVDEEARNNVEMPPRYEDLASGVDNNANVENNDNNNVSYSNTNQSSNVTVDSEITMANNQLSVNNTVNNVDNSNVPENISSVIDNLPAIDSDVNANESLTETVVNNLTVDNALSDNRLMVNNN